MMQRSGYISSSYNSYK